MKKISLKSKLSLNKETVARLNSNQMSQVQGGSSLDHQSCSGGGCSQQPTCTQDCPVTTQVPTQCFTFDPNDPLC